VGSNPAGGMDVQTPVNNVCCPVEITASDRSIVLRSLTECPVPEYDRGTSQRRPCPTAVLKL